MAVERASELVIVLPAREILLYGRFCLVQEVAHRIAHRLSAVAPGQQASGFVQVTEEAAHEAALIAEGFPDDMNEKLVNVMKSIEASGTVFDHLYFIGADELTRKYLEA
jgi:predicted butyrate kinase (DUF1464 family)